MAAKKHVHRYYRMPHSGGYVWACDLEDCTHHIPRYMEAAIRGKQSICNNCGETFIMLGNALEMSRPTCLDCRPNDRKVVEALDEVSEQSIFPSIRPESKEKTMLQKLIDMGINVDKK